MLKRGQRIKNSLQFVSGVTYVRLVLSDWRSKRPVVSLEPIKAWRLAELGYANWQFSLQPILQNSDGLEKEAFAKCNLNNLHFAPNQDCSCGFYSCKDISSLHPFSPFYWDRNSAPMVLLEVELYGKVIEHERGYRAQYQRVMKVYLSPLPGKCFSCGQTEQCLLTASRILTVCPDCIKASTRRRWLDSVGRQDEDCVIESDTEFADRLASQLGTEVAWLTPDMIEAMS